MAKCKSLQSSTIDAMLIVSTVMLGKTYLPRSLKISSHTKALDKRVHGNAIANPHP